MAGALRARDFIVYIVFSGRLVHLDPLDHLQRFFIDDLDHIIIFRAIEYIDPRIRRILMAAHEEAGSRRGDLLDGLP